MFVSLLVGCRIYGYNITLFAGLHSPASHANVTRIALPLADGLCSGEALKGRSVPCEHEINPMSDFSQPARPINAGTRIGHVHLKVADIERALGFWRDVLGFEIMQQREGAVFLSAGGYHHHIALNTWESKGGSPPPKGATGLYHVAILYPDRATLADALRRVQAAGIKLDGASDHGVSEALYLRDFDGNGVELYRDKPKEEWPRTADGTLNMITKRLDLDALLAEGG
jgi:catechol 2,3-dioxygenase